MSFLIRCLFCILSLSACKAAEAASYEFREVWAYVMQGEENHLKGSEPVTDIAYFSAVVNELGRINASPDISKIPSAVREGRKIHLVISTPSNLSLMYWCLSKDLETRSALIEDILRIAEPFDGLQIDFETMRPEEAKSYLGFLRELKSKLPRRKIFSVALPARTAEKEDAFNYAKISAIADKVLVMAYDEHWRTGSAGPIASVVWCEKVLAFAKKHVEENKLVMGIPLYGRVWQKQEVARALKYPQTLALWKQYPSLLERTSDGTPHFTYEQRVDAAVYFEDMQSLSSKLDCYEKTGVKGVGFWRVTQEPAALWSEVAVRR